MAGRDDEVVVREIERLDGPRVEADESPVAAPSEREPRDPGLDHAAVLDRGRDAAATMHQRVEIRLREDLAEDLEALFAAAHAGQPVVDQRDPERLRSHRAQLAGAGEA